MNEPAAGGGGGGAARSRVSSEQLDVLLSFMEEHPEFAFGKQSVYSRFSASKLWRLLAERLNAAAAVTSGARKSPDKWCRYWADIKYRARRKTLAGGALGDLSLHEERLGELLRAVRPRARPRPRPRPTDRVRSRGASHSDEERKAAAAGEESGGSSVSAGDAGEAGEGEGEGEEAVGSEELLAEAAMRAALAQEKTAEAAGQAVLLLRDLVELLRARAPPPPPPPPPPAPPEHLMHLPPHHHRL